MTWLYWAAFGDSLPVKASHVPKQKLHQSYMHQYLTADLCDHRWHCILPLPPSCSISGPHSDATGYNSNFNMGRCRLTEN